MTVEQRQAKLALWLKQQRQAKGLTMRTVGETLGKPHSLVGKIENCERRIDVAEFIDYCNQLGFDAFEGLRAAS